MAKKPWKWYEGWRNTLVNILCFDVFIVKIYWSLQEYWQEKRKHLEGKYTPPSSTVEICIVSAKFFVFSSKSHILSPACLRLSAVLSSPVHLRLPAASWQCLVDEQAGASPRQLPFQPDSCISQVVWHLRWRLWIRLKVF